MAEEFISAEEKEEIRQEEFPNPLLTQASNGLPLLVPWGREVVMPGKSFESRNMMNNPWIDKSPFKSFGQHQPYLIYEPNGDAHAYFRSAESESHGTSTEHHSASLGATVDVKFASASVTGSFDKNVQENKDSNKVSRNVFYRAGVIQFAEEPILTYGAREMLGNPNGEQEFQSQFGDYYVAGISLGGDSGAYLSVDMDTKTTTEKATIKATVKVCFFKPKTWTKSTTHVEVENHLAVTFFGYDTMENTKAEPKTLSLEIAHKDIIEYTELADSLDTRITDKIAQLGIQKGQAFSIAQCAGLFSSGVVVHLLLAPFHTLLGYKRAVADRV